MDEWERRERESKCAEAKAAKQAAFDQIAVLNEQISRQSEIASTQAARATEAEENMAIAVDTASDERAAAQAAIDNRQRLRDERAAAAERLETASSRVEASKSLPSFTGIIDAVLADAEREATAALKALEESLSHADSPIQGARERLRAAEERIAGYQATISEASNAATRARAEAAVATEERSRRESERSQAESAISQYCG